MWRLSSRLKGSVPFDDLDDGILAQPQFAADQAIAAAFSDQGENFGSEAVRFRPLSGLAAEVLAACLRRGNAGADACSSSRSKSRSSSQWTLSWREMDSNFRYAGAVNLVVAYALKSDIERAAAELAEARRLSRDDRYMSIARLRAEGYWGVPKVQVLFETTYFAGLRKAGMPEE